jgi:hypothetical protein
MSRSIPIYFVLLSLVWPFPVFAQFPVSVSFEKEEVGKFPSGWVSRRTREAATIYSIQSEAGKKFLHADARDAAIQIGYETKWHLAEYPMLEWQWRAILFPTGTDEQKKGGNDSALAVYVVLRGWPKSVTFFPTTGDSSGTGRTIRSPTGLRS